MTIAILSILGGLVLLALGAEGLVRGSASVALRLGIAPLVVGLTIVAFGTGSPELVVSVSAALEGSSSIALGNVVGSNISNIALILGTAAIVAPMTVRAEVIRREVPLMIAVLRFGPTTAPVRTNPSPAGSSATLGAVSVLPVAATGALAARGLFRNGSSHAASYSADAIRGSASIRRRTCSHGNVRLAFA